MEMRLLTPAEATGNRPSDSSPEPGHGGLSVAPGHRSRRLKFSAGLWEAVGRRLTPVSGYQGKTEAGSPLVTRGLITADTRLMAQQE